MIRRSRISVRPNVRPAAPRGAAQDSRSHSGGAGGGAPTGQSESGRPEAETPVSTSAPTRRKRFSVLPNLGKPRAALNPARTTPDVPLCPVGTSPDPHESPIGTKPTAEVPSASSESEPHFTPKPPPSSIPDPSRTHGSPIGTQPTAEVPSASSECPRVSHSINSEPPEPCFTPKSPPSSILDPPGVPESPLRPLSPVPARNPPPEPRSSPGDTKSPGPPAQTPPTAGALESEAANGDGPSEGGSRGRGRVEPTPLRLKTLNDPADAIRLARAKKLRDLLKEELSREKKGKNPKPKAAVREPQKVKDHTKMTMRELIYYLPPSNPMRSRLEDEQQTEASPPLTPPPLPPSPRPGPTAAAPLGAEQRGAEQREEEQREGEQSEAEQREGEQSEAEPEGPPLAPRVKVAEDGSLIIDEESLTVQVQRQKGPSVVEDRDPIFERGSTTTYSSFRRGSYTKPWSTRETDMFFLAISMVGTDFSMIGQLFPHRARVEIKNKFKKEERANTWRIDKAFREKRRLDLDYFKGLLEKILKEQERRRRKARDPGGTQAAKRRRRRVNSWREEEEEEEGGSLSSDTMDGEREKENVCEETGSAGASRRANRAAEQGGGENVVEGRAEEPADGLQGSDPGEEPGEGSGVEARVRKRRNNRDPQSTTRKLCEGSATKARPAPSCDLILLLEDSEEDDEPDLASIQENILNKPTRSGRIPKLSQHVIRAAAADEVEAPPLPPLRPRPPASAAKGGGASLPRRGKSQLVTLRASGEEEDDDDDDEEEEEEDDEEEGTGQQERSTSVEEEIRVFVPVGLRSVPEVQAEVEETMEELDISQHAPQSEHQLDLLVDVMEILDPDHMEVSEEAARTLLTIGLPAQVTPGLELDDVVIVEEPSSLLEQEICEEFFLDTTAEPDAPTLGSALSGRGCSENLRPDLSVASGTVPNPPQPLPDEEQKGGTGGSEDHASVEERTKVCSESKSADPGSESAVKPGPAIRRCRGVKPKPNLTGGARTAPRQNPAERAQTSNARAPPRTPAVTSAPAPAGTPQEGGVVTMKIPDLSPDVLNVSARGCPPSPAEATGDGVFVLSLTEVTPTPGSPAGATEGSGVAHVAPPLPGCSVPAPDGEATVSAQHGGEGKTAREDPGAGEPANRPDVRVEPPQSFGSERGGGETETVAKRRKLPQSRSRPQIGPGPVQRRLGTPGEPSESSGTARDTGELGAESRPVHQITPPATSAPTRTNRRPKGFLSFMSGSRRPPPAPRAPPTAAPSAPPTQSSSTEAGPGEGTTSVAAFSFDDIFTVVEGPGQAH